MAMRRVTPDDVSIDWYSNNGFAVQIDGYDVIHVDLPMTGAEWCDVAIFNQHPDSDVMGRARFLLDAEDE